MLLAAAQGPTHIHGRAESWDELAASRAINQIATDLISLDEDDAGAQRAWLGSGQRWPTPRVRSPATCNTAGARHARRSACLATRGPYVTCDMWHMMSRQAAHRGRFLCTCDGLPVCTRTRGLCRAYLAWPPRH